MSEVTPQNINSTFVVLDDASNAIPIAVGDRFYEKLEQQFGDFKGKRLISHYTFEQDWDSWESHPAGEEFVCLLSGQIDFVLEQEGGEEVVSLNTPGQYILVPRGVWHTAKVHTSSSVLFITPGEGTQSRPLHATAFGGSLSQPQ
jgi:mannose-6-phosphate isomerase-like protein (cupin superfamily)